eukprot:5238170-Pyramimonas_sp.AAC.1
MALYTQSAASPACIARYTVYTYAAAPTAWVAHFTRMHTDAAAPPARVPPCTRKQLPSLHAQCPVACKRAHVVSYENLLEVHDPEPMSYMRPRDMCALEPMHAPTMTAPTSNLPANIACIPPRPAEVQPSIGAQRVYVCTLCASRRNYARM